MTRDFTVKTHTVTVRDARLIFRAAGGDVDAATELVLSRTDMSEAELDSLSFVELVQDVLPRITDALEAATVIDSAQSLLRRLGPEEVDP